MPEHLIDELGRLAAAVSHDDPLFTGPTGGGLDYSNWRYRVWAPAVKAAGLVGVTPHATRHTTASWLVQAGVPLYSVQQLLGHESPAMTMRYAHLAPDAFDDVRQALSRARSVQGQRAEPGG
jgi:integrase